MGVLLQVTDVTKIYTNQPKPGLDGVSFEVNEGEFLGIMGASGSGKTTLLNVLSTIDTPTSGKITMGRTNIQKLNQTQAADFRKNNLGFIFQEYFLLDSLTVQENIAVPLTLLHRPAREITAKVKGPPAQGQQQNTVQSNARGRQPIYLRLPPSCTINHDI